MDQNLQLAIQSFAEVLGVKPKLDGVFHFTFPYVSLQVQVATGDHARAYFPVGEEIHQNHAIGLAYMRDGMVKPVGWTWAADMETRPVTSIDNVVHHFMGWREMYQIGRLVYLSREDRVEREEPCDRCSSKRFKRTKIVQPGDVYSFRLDCEACGRTKGFEEWQTPISA